MSISLFIQVSNFILIRPSSPPYRFPLIPNTLESYSHTRENSFLITVRTTFS